MVNKAAKHTWNRVQETSLQFTTKGCVRVHEVKVCETCGAVRVTSRVGKLGKGFHIEYVMDGKLTLRAPACKGSGRVEIGEYYNDIAYEDIINGQSRETEVPKGEEPV